MANSIGELIEKEVAVLNQQEHNYQKLGIIFNLIELRNGSTDESHKRDLFLDVKKMIYYYVASINESYYGYYEVNSKNSQNVLQKISYLKTNEQINLIELLQRRLKLAGYLDESDFFDKELDRLKLKILLKEREIVSFCKAISILSSKNILTLIISILIIYLLYSVILLPAPVKWMELFTIDYENYSSYFLSNHFGNTLLSFCQIESDFKIHPRSFGGVILLILIKVSILVLMFNFFISELKRKFKL